MAHLARLLLLLFVVSLMSSPARAQGTGYSLRFYGHGVNDIDRVKIPIDSPAVPADIGSTDFTLEFWMKASPGTAGSIDCIAGWDQWIYGHIIFDRDIYGEGDYGDFGVSIYRNGLSFGVATSNDGAGLCGATDVDDGQWHHVAVTRSMASGDLRLFVDGQLDGSATGPAGNASYRNGRSSQFPNDPYLVIGAEKHDAGGAYPSFDGWVDEVRLSNVIRYAAAFTPPGGNFSPDANTVALYHFDQGPAGPCSGTVVDGSGASGGPSNGTCSYGGTGTAGPVYTTDTPLLGNPNPNCGNSLPDPGEECDDGNATSGDGCDANCTMTRCGNGIPTPNTGEQCDDGNQTAGDGCEPNCTFTPYQRISGKRLFVRDRDGDARKRKVLVCSKDATIPGPAAGSAADPTLGPGAVLRLWRDTGDFVDLSLPAAGWRRLGTPPGSQGYSFRGTANGPCRSARLKAGWLRVACSGDQIGFALDEPSQGTLALTFRPGSAGLRSCLVFGGEVLKDAPATSGRTGRFKARNAPAPTTCPIP